MRRGGDRCVLRVKGPSGKRVESVNRRVELGVGKSSGGW